MRYIGRYLVSRFNCREERCSARPPFSILFSSSHFCVSQASPEHDSREALDKHLLEQNFPQVERELLHNIYACHNESFEDTVRTLQEALSSDRTEFSEAGRAARERRLVEMATACSLQVSGGGGELQGPARHKINLSEEYHNYHTFCGEGVPMGET